MQHLSPETRKELAHAIYSIFIHDAENIEIYYGQTNVLISVSLNDKLDVDGVKKAQLHDFHSYIEE